MGDNRGDCASRSGADAGPRLVLVRVATPLRLTNVVVGTLEPVPPGEATHEGGRLDGPLRDLHDVGLSQANVRLEARSGALIFQSSKADSPEQRRVRRHDSESGEGELCVCEVRGARSGEVEYRWKRGTRRIAGSELEQWEDR